MKKSKNNIKLGEYDWITPLTAVVQLIKWETCELGEGGYSVHLMVCVETDKPQAAGGHPLLMTTRLGGPDKLESAYSGFKLAQSLVEGIAMIIEIRDSVTNAVIETLQLQDVLDAFGDKSDYTPD